MHSIVQSVTYEAKKGRELAKESVDVDLEKCFVQLTVFFFAKSPEAPRTMMTVLSLSSIVLYLV